MNLRKLFLAVAAVYGLLWINGVSPVNVTPSGTAERVLVVHDASRPTPAMNILATTVQGTDSEIRRWADAKGMTIQFLSTNAVEADGKPAAIIRRFAPYKPPELLILDSSATRCIRRQPCPMNPADFAKAIGK